ncbi:MAG: hypothetical protein A2086_08650 [Spirochaetes bacterium GWD1_27_9]|nr:MAG: hypothetical protein A2Z98_13750 [Spirochaetes bacterium GWB1_27_13]OHD24572.1 MAG: hypothetical protein A2Y34_18880 [Spirochaetes bacterium GWC1_27_15]OHD40540.1 MAG: hypothetical protein A2086_08650 [Spirochaetes bacterium GWD1_27_9]
MKKKKAASINYLKDDVDVPIISSLGEGDFAKEIIEVAKQNGIKIIENEEFFYFEKLFKVGEEIPQDVYQIVIDILVTILKTNEPNE